MLETGWRLLLLFASWVWIQLFFLGLWFSWGSQRLFANDDILNICSCRYSRASCSDQTKKGGIRILVTIHSARYCRNRQLYMIHSTIPFKSLRFSFIITCSWILNYFGFEFCSNCQEGPHVEITVDPAWNFRPKHVIETLNGCQLVVLAVLP
jgi:hypothetical protein